MERNDKFAEYQERRIENAQEWVERDTERLIRDLEQLSAWLRESYTEYQEDSAERKTPRYLARRAVGHLESIVRSANELNTASELLQARHEFAMEHERAYPTNELEIQEDLDADTQDPETGVGRG